MRVKLLVMGMMVGLCGACKKDKATPKGNAQADFNGSVWSSNKTTGEPSRFGVNDLIDIYMQSQDGASHFSFGNVGKHTNRQKLYEMLGNVDTPKNCWTIYITSQDNDITGDEYDLLESDAANNWLQITSADNNFTKNIRGTFSATYYRSKTYQGFPNPDTIRLRNGTFYISKLKE